MRIGRLATSLSVRRQGLGELLLQNAIKRVLQARTTLGVHAVLVEAKNSAAEGFYHKYGFRLCDSKKSDSLILPLGAVRLASKWQAPRLSVAPFIGRFVEAATADSGHLWTIEQLSIACQKADLRQNPATSLRGRS